MHMKELKCPNCGAPLREHSYKCEYCGSQFKYDNGDCIRIENFQSPCKIYKEKISITREMETSIGTEKAAELAVLELSRELAKAITPNMELEAYYDPFKDCREVEATVRILEPDFRFK